MASVLRRASQGIFDQFEHLIAIKPQGFLAFKNKLVAFSGRDYCFYGPISGNMARVSRAD